MEVTKIKEAVMALSPEDFRDFRIWFADFKKKLPREQEEAWRNLQAARQLEIAAAPAAPHRPVKYFWRHHGDLPAEIRAQAEDVLRSLNRNPLHPGVQFRKKGMFWTIPIGPDHEVRAIKDGDVFFWFWIGPCDRSSAEASRQPDGTTGAVGGETPDDQARLTDETPTA